jgi:xylan 1,4-beta-xylosidase
LRTPECVVVKTKNNTYKGIAWNVDERFTGNKITLDLEFPLPTTDNVLITQLVDEETCNPQKVWHDIGEPANPSKDEVKLIQQGANPLTSTKRCDNKLHLELKSNGVCYFEIKNAPIKSDTGFSFGRYE